jgi:probable F420-dependent oxidoreductase
MSRDRRTPALLVLHGHGDDGRDARRLAEQLALGWPVHAPAAPFGRDGATRSWFDTGPRGVDVDSLSRSRELLGEVIARCRPAPVVVVGFSQGAAMALALGDVDGVDAVVGFCGFLPEDDTLDLAAGPVALLLAGAQDDVVPPFLCQDAAAAMSAAGREVTAEVFPGGHEVGDAAVRRARAWLRMRHPDRLRVSANLPTDRVDTGAELVSADAVGEIASAYERLGYDATFVTDHPAPDDRWLEAGGHHALEPTVALMAAAMATTTLRLHTHILVLGYRNPFLVAKSVASLDVLSGGRVILGVAAGYLRAEFAALGADFPDRGRRLEEALELLPRIWAGRSLAVEGDGYRARGATLLPRPAQRPHPPIWVGGNSEAAMRRAVRFAQGWSPFPTRGGLERAARTARISGVEELRMAVQRFESIAASEDVQRPTVCFALFSLQDWARRGDSVAAQVREEAEEVFELGVDWITVSLPGLGRSEVIERAAALASVLDLEGI